MNKNYRFLIKILCITLFASDAMAYTDRSLISYFTENVIWRFVVSGGYYSLGFFLILMVLSIIFKSFRATIISLGMALFALFLFVLMYEVVQEMSWVEIMPGS